MSHTRLALIATPRTGNTWFAMLLSKFYNVPRVAVTHVGESDWNSLPSELVYQVHARRDDALVKRLRQEGFQIITLARHPLDVLISILHVTVYDVQSEKWLEGSHGDEQSIWAATPRSRNFIDYCRSARARELLSVTSDFWHRPDVLSFKYEDLVLNPDAALRAVEIHVGPPRIADVAAMIAKHSLSELRTKANNNHFWKGQPGLWRKLLPLAETQEIAEAIRPIAEQLEYALDPDPQLDAQAADFAWNAAAGADMGRTIRRNVAIYQRETEELQRANAALTDANQTLEQTNVRLWEESKEVRHAAAKVWENSKVIQQANASLHETQKSLHETIERLQETNAQLWRDNQALHQTGVEVWNRCKTLEQANAQLHAGASVLQLMLEQLQSANSRIWADMTSLRESNSQMWETNREQQRMNRELWERAAAVDRENGQIHADYAALQADIKAQQAINAELWQANQTLHRTNGELSISN